MGKHVTIEFFSSPRRYEKDMDKAKKALGKIKAAGMATGEIKVDGIEITIKDTVSGPC